LIKAGTQFSPQALRETRMINESRKDQYRSPANEDQDADQLTEGRAAGRARQDRLDRIAAVAVMKRHLCDILRTQAAPMRFEVRRSLATRPTQKRIHGLS
jgi:hypothetical protein